MFAHEICICARIYVYIYARINMALVVMMVAVDSLFLDALYQASSVGGYTTFDLFFCCCFKVTNTSLTIRITIFVFMSFQLFISGLFI